MSSNLADTFVRFESGGECFEVPIERGAECGFGRALSNAVVLTDTLASREHATIRRSVGGQCRLSDLGSTNGTRLNGRQVTEAMPLSSGDIIQIGRQSIVFVQTVDPEPEPEAVDEADAS